MCFVCKWQIKKIGSIIYKNIIKTKIETLALPKTTIQVLALRRPDMINVL